MGEVGKLPRTHDIVLDGLGGVPFHQRHVFMRCGVQDDIRPPCGKQLLHPRSITNIPHTRNQLDVRGFSGKLAVHVE